MKLGDLRKTVFAMATLALALGTANVSADTGEQYAICKAELKAMYGEDTRVQLYGTKSYRGVTTLKLKVKPEGLSSITVQCSGDTEADERVVLKDKNGDTLAS
ncbi:MAG: hypothetical protein VW035_05295 [Luminiphilus sp.]|jgi:hypothetical protein